MITEDYVSFETAKLLKEKGFDGPCCKVWESRGETQTLVGSAWFVEGETVVNRESVDAAAKQYAYELNLNSVEGYLAPTLQMVMKWLREIHDLFIFISTWTMLEDSIQYYFEIREIKTRDFETLYDYTSKELNSFEKVAEAAIKYCLENLI